MLLPSGPDGALTQAQTGSFWSAPSGTDSGDLPVPATAVYHVNADGTSTITLTPDQPLATDVYLISVNGLVDLAGNPLLGANGTPGAFYASFDDRPPTSNSAPQVASVTAGQGAIVIDNNRIPQPDTIGIRFNKPMDAYTINSQSVQLFAQGVAGPLKAAVAYSPTTDTAYLTPEEMLTPETVYYVSVSRSVTDSQGFPSPGEPLSTAFATSFTVSSAGVQTSGGASPLTVLRTDPLNGTEWKSPLGYGAVTFSRAIDPSSLGRFSVMLIPQTGGVTTGTSGYADVPVNAKIAFNPNTDQIVIVPTGGLEDGTVYLFALSNIKAADGSVLGGTIYSTFKLNASVQKQVAIREAVTPSEAVVIPASSTVPSSSVMPSLPVDARRDLRTDGLPPRFNRPRWAVAFRLATHRFAGGASRIASFVTSD